MTIVLQHQFSDLRVYQHHFEVGLSFSGTMERISVPYAAISSFIDPTVDVDLQCKGDVVGFVWDRYNEESYLSGEVYHDIVRGYGLPAINKFNRSYDKGQQFDISLLHESSDEKSYIYNEIWDSICQRLSMYREPSAKEFAEDIDVNVDEKVIPISRYINKKREDDRSW